MKKSIITLSFLSTAMLSFAQEVTVKKDIIYKNGEPYCKMIKKGSIVKDYTLSTLEGTPFLELRYNVEEQDYTATFIESLQQGTVVADWGFTKMVAKEAVETNLIKDGNFNPAGEAYFLKLHPLKVGSTLSNQGQKVGTIVYEYPLAERSRSKPLMIIGKEISQDLTTIGSYQVETNAQGGDIVKTFTFALPNGIAIATATVVGINGKSARVVAVKNHLPFSVSFTTIGDSEIAKIIATELVQRMFL